MYKRIMVPIDGSATSDKGLEEALRLGRALGAGLVLLHVVNEQPLLMQTASAVAYDEQRRQMLKQGDTLVGAASMRALDAGLTSEAVIKELTAGRVADAIVRETARCGCDLVVMGTHGRRGVSRLVLGSDAELVVRESPVPVMLIRSTPAPMSDGVGSTAAAR